MKSTVSQRIGRSIIPGFAFLRGFFLKPKLLGTVGLNWLSWTVSSPSAGFFVVFFRSGLQKMLHVHQGRLWHGVQKDVSLHILRRGFKNKAIA